MIIKQIDINNRLVIPKEYRKAIGVTDKVKMDLIGEQIIITNPNGMKTQTEIEQIYQRACNLKPKNEYNKGFEDALKMVLNK